MFSGVYGDGNDTKTLDNDTATAISGMDETYELEARALLKW